MFDVHKIALAVTAVVFAATMLTEKSSNAAESVETFAGPLTAIPAEQQIQLAMGAAPSHISENASVYVLGPKGYVKARTGMNGFSCLVERQYMETLDNDPKLKYVGPQPHCYDAEGSATTLQAKLYREELRATGIPEEEIQRKLDDGYKAGILKAPRKPGLVYMLSTHTRAYVPRLKKIIQVPPHVMFYAPYATNKDFGGFVGDHVPFVIQEGQPDAYIIVIPSRMSAALQQAASAAENGAQEHSHGEGSENETK